jgi:hypothetical protein
MIEAVGHEHMQAYFQTLGAMLRPGGKCVIQVGREAAPACFCVVAAITATCPCHVLIALLRYWAKAADAVTSCFHSISAACRITNHARACVCTVQVIAQPDERYEAYCKTSDFIREHIFPGEQLQGKGGSWHKYKFTQGKLAASRAERRQTTPASCYRHVPFMFALQRGRPNPAAPLLPQTLYFPALPQAATCPAWA